MLTQLILKFIVPAAIMVIICKLTILVWQDVININIRTDGITVVMTVVLNVAIVQVHHHHHAQIAKLINTFCPIRQEATVWMIVQPNTMLKLEQTVYLVTEHA